jgi:very-short-patch-repair endonuclease
MCLAYEYGKSGDTRLAALAAAQHGVVATRQLLNVGYSHHAIHTRMAAGRLHRLHRGVYAVGHTRISMRGRWLAAVLACGPHSFLSHRTAAALHDLRARTTGEIDVTAPSKHRFDTDADAVRCHVSRRPLHPADTTTVDAIPVTSVPRTLLDLAETLGPQQLRSTLEAAQRQDLLNFLALDALIARSPGRHGIRPLTEALSHLRDEAPWTQSELERRFLELIRDAGLPEPQCNVIVDGVVVDFYWPQHELIVEVDGYRFHKTKRSFEEDRRRDARHAVGGRRVIRATHARIVHGPRSLLADLVSLLSAGPGRAA